MNILRQNYTFDTIVFNTKTISGLSIVTLLPVGTFIRYCPSCKMEIENGL